MVFISKEFPLFLIVVFILYWFFFYKSAKKQNIILLLASLFFYGWADWRFLFIVILNALLNFYIGVGISNTHIEKTKKRFLWLGILINLGVLGYFKYFNFFSDSFDDLFNLFGANLHYSSLNIILPLGISFFTFQTLGYIIDVYNEKIEPYRDLLVFTTYVTYFPKILSGPIERAQNFIPQIVTRRVFDYKLASDGLRQILWGLFTKVVIADRCATFVNGVFNNDQDQSSYMLIAGLFFYLIQIYSDFSGYSNIAIGVSKLFGIKLMINFAYPFFSTNIGDFWKKWHISLTTWLMDYVFTPLSFILRKYKRKGLFLSILITFILVGFWHGANWTFIVFGFLQGMYFLPIIVKRSLNSYSTINKYKLLPSLKEFLQMAGLFCLIMFTVVFFRADNVIQAFKYLNNMFTSDIYHSTDSLKPVWYLPLFLIIPEWFQRNKEHVLQFNNENVHIIVRWVVYYILLYIIIYFVGNHNSFIYERF